MRCVYSCCPSHRSDVGEEHRIIMLLHELQVRTSITGKCLSTTAQLSLETSRVPVTLSYSQTPRQITPATFRTFTQRVIGLAASRPLNVRHLFDHRAFLREHPRTSKSLSATRPDGENYFFQEAPWCLFHRRQNMPPLSHESSPPVAVDPLCVFLRQGYPSHLPGTRARHRLRPNAMTSPSGCTV